MRLNQVIKLRVFNTATSSWEDVTNGVLSIDTVTGSDSFDGFWDQADTGQFVITTRGATSDPNLNPLIKSNALINILVDVPDSPTASDQDIFYGFITDVSVKYNKNEKQTVTINGTDLIGYLNRLVVTQDFIDTNIIPTYPDALVPVDYLIDYATYALAPELQEIFFIRYTNLGEFSNIVGGGTGGFILELPETCRVKVEAGDTLYNLISLGMSSGLMRYESWSALEYYFLPYYKNDPFMYSGSERQLLEGRQYIALTNYEDPIVTPPEFDLYNTKGVFTYRGITLNNGLNKMINQVSVSNTDPATDVTTTIEPLSSVTDIETYGPAELNASTVFTTTTNPFWLGSSAIADQAEYFQSNILFDQATPYTQIETITVDMALWFLEGMDVPDNGASIWVQHRLENDEYIKGFYKIVGVRHRITESEWLAEFILRPSEYISLYDNRPKVPTFTFTSDEAPVSGTYTTAANLTLSINNYTAEDLAEIESIEWFVNFFQVTNAPAGPGNPPSQINEKLGYSLPVFNGTSVTWNFDDNGPLENFSLYPEYFLDVMIGPGYYYSYVYIKQKNGIISSYEAADLAIVAATAHADFIFTKAPNEVVTFTDTSGADTNTWEWDFGDGTTYSGKTPPPKQYATAGTYNVRLDVDNGFTTDHIIKPVTINIYQIPVQYIKLRYQGTVTRPAGETEYPVDLIDTIGLLEVLNTNFTQTGGIQPFYFGRIGTLEKVQEIGKGNNYQWLRILDDPITKANHEEWIYQASPLNPADPVTPYTPYSPLFTTNYASGGPLDPMSQTWRDTWNVPTPRGTMGATVPKYRFIPVITDNEDGSQTKSIDIDINFWYSQTYVAGSSTSSSSSVYRKWYNNQPAGAGATGGGAPVNPSYLPGGRLASLAYWPEWGSGTTTDYNQSLKVKEINIWPGMDTKVKKTTGKQNVNIGGNTFIMFDPPVDPPLDRYGVQSGKTYLPIEIAVSDNGTTFHKIGEANYVSGNKLTTTYDVSMPPFSDAPILT